MKFLLPLLLWVPMCIFGQIRETEVQVNPLINGTLFEPDGRAKTMIVLIAGSGPTNRSGNQVGAFNNSLRLLAQGLAARGCAVYSYDKRLFALMATDEADESRMRFEDMITDARAVLSHFKNLGQYDKIVVAGHSEGSLIGMVAAKENADAFISIAGAGRPADALIADQVAKIAPGRAATTRKYLELLRAGRTFKPDGDPFVESFLRESVQPYMISWMAYDPAQCIGQLNIPVLIVNGTRDLQVPESEAELLKNAAPKARFALIANMNHVLKIISQDQDDNRASYNDPSRPVADALLDEMELFVKHL